MDKEFNIAKYIYIIVIVIVSLCGMIILPLFTSSEFGYVSLNFPNTTAGWVLYAFQKGVPSVIGIMILVCFDCQGKENVKDKQKYKDALVILGKYNPKEYKPISPSVYHFKIYSVKGTTTVLTSTFSMVAITSSILQYDYNYLLAFSFTLVMNIVIGILRMKSSEDYWENEFYDYAKFIERTNTND